ncbi:hypothetical protein RDI58_003621 [Solanum bulbocastanum]|uniref:RING-type domain-containing protein n=1 Tax=Solanum bulbocastanum TaxID=147425 RepID=A0AAN8UI29_SOLBU
MGSACCVAAKDRAVINGSTRETLQSNVRYSPSWSFRWDNRGRVAGEETSVNWSSDGVGGNDRLEFKSGTVETLYASEEGSPLDSFRSLALQKSPASDCNMGNSMLPLSGSIRRELNWIDVYRFAFAGCSENIIKFLFYVVRCYSRLTVVFLALADTSVVRNSTEVKESFESSAVPCPSPLKLSSSDPSVSSLSASPLSTKSQLLLANSTPLPQYSSGHHLGRRVSDSHIPRIKSPTFSISEESSSFMLPGWSNESTRGSNGGSSDGWSVPAFSDLLANPRRDRWSFDSESMGFHRDKMSRASGRSSGSPSIDLQTCGICTKLLTERSSWSSNELAVVSVLICGHVFHAECLESMTPEFNKYDPACPVCTFGEKQALKMSEKALKSQMDLKARKRFRNRVVDSDFSGNLALFDQQKSGGHGGRRLKMSSSSSSMKSSSGKPFLLRHFSFGSKGSKSFSESPSSRKKDEQNEATANETKQSEIHLSFYTETRVLNLLRGSLGGAVPAYVFCDMADLRDEHGNPIQLTDQYGHPVQLTDEYGNPMHLTGVATTAGSTAPTVFPTGTGAAPAGEKLTQTASYAAPTTIGEKLHHTTGLGAGAPTIGEKLHHTTGLGAGAPTIGEKLHHTAGLGTGTGAPTIGEKSHHTTGLGAGTAAGAGLGVGAGTIGEKLHQKTTQSEQQHHKTELHRSGSSSSSSSEDDGQGGRRKKKGLKEKIKEKLTGGKHKDEEPHHHSHGIGTGATTTTTSGMSSSTAPEHEKKSMMEKIKEKLPGHHNHH